MAVKDVAKSHRQTRLMGTRALILLPIAALVGFAVQAHASTIALGTAGDFAVLAGTTVTNTGPTVVRGGHVGVSPGSAITGFLLGGILSATNLYVSAKTGITLGVGLTSVILAFGMFKVLSAMRRN